MFFGEMCQNDIFLFANTGEMEIHSRLICEMLFDWLSKFYITKVS